MARSRRLTNGTRWRTFMRLLRLDDLMASYTNAGAPELYASGHLLFVRDGTLFAQAFDDRALQTSGDPVRLGDHVGHWSAGLGYAAVTVSPASVLAHGPSVGLTTSLRWHDRSGASTGSPTAPAQYSSPR